MDMQVLAIVLARAAIVYAFLFIVVRLLGKRKLGVHSALDLVVAIVMADLASQAVFGTVTLTHGLFAVAVVAGLHFAGYHLRTRSRRVQRWLRVDPAILIRDGEVLAEVLATEHLAEADLWSLLRQHGIENIAEVKLAILEPSGHLSVVRQEWAREARRGDLPTTSERSNA